MCTFITVKLKALETMSPFSKVYQAKGDEKRQGEGGVIKSKKWASVDYGCPLCNTACFPTDSILLGRFL